IGPAGWRGPDTASRPPARGGPARLAAGSAACTSDSSATGGTPLPDTPAGAPIATIARNQYSSNQIHVGTRACARPSRRIMIRLAQPIMIGWVAPTTKKTHVELHTAMEPEPLEQNEW